LRLPIDTVFITLHYLFRISSPIFSWLPPFQIASWYLFALPIAMPLPLRPLKAIRYWLRLPLAISPLPVYFEILILRHFLSRCHYADYVIFIDIIDDYWGHFLHSFAYSFRHFITFHYEAITDIFAFDLLIHMYIIFAITDAADIIDRHISWRLLPLHYYWYYYIAAAFEILLPLPLLMPLILLMPYFFRHYYYYADIFILLISILITPLRHIIDYLAFAIIDWYYQLISFIDFAFRLAIITPPLPRDAAAFAIYAIDYTPLIILIIIHYY